MQSWRFLCVLLVIAGTVSTLLSACATDSGAGGATPNSQRPPDRLTERSPSPGDQTDQRPKASRSFEALDLLAGHWRAEAGPKIVFEQWQRTDDGLAGSGAMADSPDGQPKVYERIKLTLLDGQMAYVVTGAGNPEPVAFMLTNQVESRWQFENPEHDFPKRIDYLLIDANHYRVEVSDGSGGQGFALDFYRRGPGKD